MPTEPNSAKLRHDNGGSHSVIVNDHDITRAVLALRLDVKYDRPVELVLTLNIPTEAAIKGRVRVHTDTFNALVALGWTPPDPAMS